MKKKEGLRYGRAKKGNFLTAFNCFNVDQNLFMDDVYMAYDDYDYGDFPIKTKENYADGYQTPRPFWLKHHPAKA